MISCFHNASGYRQYFHVGKSAEHCRPGLSQDSDLLEDLTSGGIFCSFGSRSFVPISWMCKKQTAVSHSSAESDVKSFDAGLRIDGIKFDTLHHTTPEAGRLCCNANTV